MKKAGKGYCGNFYVDINGVNGPNIVGEDIRGFWLWGDGFVRFYGDPAIDGRKTFTTSKLKPAAAYQPPDGECVDPYSYTTVVDYD